MAPFAPISVPSLGSINPCKRAEILLEVWGSSSFGGEDQRLSGEAADHTSPCARSAGVARRWAGTATMVLVGRDEDGGGTMEVIATQPTTEQGVELQIPVRQDDIDAMRVRATSLFRYWSPGQVLVDGFAPERIDGLWIDDHLLLTEHAERMPLSTSPSQFFSSP